MNAPKNTTNYPDLMRSTVVYPKSFLSLLHLWLVASGCDGAPLLPLLYLATNIAFNISLLNLVKISSAVVSTLAAMASGPLPLSLSHFLSLSNTEKQDNKFGSDSRKYF